MVSATNKSSKWLPFTLSLLIHSVTLFSVALRNHVASPLAAVKPKPTINIELLEFQPIFPTQLVQKTKKKSSPKKHRQNESQKKQKLPKPSLTKSSHKGKSTKSFKNTLPKKELPSYIHAYFEISPSYPTLSQSLNEEGRVVLKVKVDCQRKRLQPLKITSSSGYQRLDQAAMEAVRLARVVNPLPTELLDGTETLIPIRFDLSENDNDHW